MSKFAKVFCSVFGLMLLLCILVIECGEKMVGYEDEVGVAIAVLAVVAVLMGVWWSITTPDPEHGVPPDKDKTGG